MDLRTVTLTIPPQEVITRDNVPARPRVAPSCSANGAGGTGYQQACSRSDFFASGAANNHV